MVLQCRLLKEIVFALAAQESLKGNSYKGTSVKFKVFFNFSMLIPCGLYLAAH